MTAVINRRRVLACGLALVLLAGAGCASSAARARGSAEVLRLGLVSSFTQAPGHVALGAGILPRSLAPTRLAVTSFNSGVDAAIAMSAGAIDAAYLGPWPTAALYLRSGEVAVVSGATVGGASFVVRRGAGIRDAEDLHGTKVAVPGVSNTQDIALRAWLQRNGLRTREHGGDVAVVEVDNPAMPELFRTGGVDGAWVPEPYPTYLVDQGLAEVFVDESTLWPDGSFLTANLVVSTAYMDAHPGVVRALVRGNVEALRFMQAQPARAEQIARRGLIEAGAPALGQDVLHEAWGKLSFTWDPLPHSMRRVVDDAFAVGALDEPPGDITGLYRLDALRGVLDDMGLPAVEIREVAT